MDVIYKSISGRTENIGTFAILGGYGTQLSEAVPEIDAEVGKLVTKETLDYASEVSVTTHNHKPQGIQETEPEPAPVEP